jgi:hypothetical protein
LILENSDEYKLSTGQFVMKYFKEENRGDKLLNIFKLY